MKLSTKGRYGLRAMVELARTSMDGPVSIQSIAKSQNLSDKYLEQILGMLKKAGLVTSSRGIQGGYQVAGKLSEISVGDILRALEGELSVVDCAGFDKEPSCQTAQFCVAKYVWKKMNDTLEDTVNHITLEELVDQSRSIQTGTGDFE